MLVKNELYDFVEVTQAQNLDKQVYFIENNVEVYRKASRLLTVERERRNIVKMNSISNLFNLHSIENV